MLADHVRQLTVTIIGDGARTGTASRRTRSDDRKKIR
jgi:hypothetical protein